MHHRKSRSLSTKRPKQIKSKTLNFKEEEQRPK